MELEFLTVKDIQRILRIGINQTYDLCKSGAFPCFKVGQKYRIPKDEFQKWCESLAHKECSANKEK